MDRTKDEKVVDEEDDMLNDAIARGELGEGSDLNKQPETAQFHDLCTGMILLDTEQSSRQYIVADWYPSSGVAAIEAIESGISGVHVTAAAFRDGPRYRILMQPILRPKESPAQKYNRHQAENDHAAGRTYIGVPRVGKYQDEFVFVAGKDIKGLAPLTHTKDIVNHSPDGHSWGYSGSGPAQLAFDLLRDLLPQYVGFFGSHPGVYQEFKDRVIKHLKQGQPWFLDGIKVLCEVREIMDQVLRRA